MDLVVGYLSLVFFLSFTDLMETNIILIVKDNNTSNWLKRNNFYLFLTHLLSSFFFQFGSGVDFPEFCIKSTSAKTFRTANLSSCFAVKKEWQSRNTDALPEASIILDLTLSFRMNLFYFPEKSSNWVNLSWN